MKKKILLAISMVAVLICLFAISVSAATELGGLYYELSGTGENAIAKLTADNVNCTIENVVIPETVEYNGVTYKVTELKESTFGGSGWPGNKTIKSVVIPKSVTTIGNHTFRNCSNLESVTIKAKNENGISLSNANFYSCTSLIYVDMSESDITTLGQYCFWGCSVLTTIKFSPRLTSAGNRSFNNCNALTSLDFRGTQLTTLQGVWSAKALTKIILPSTLTTIYSNGIQETALTTIVLPHGIESLATNSLANNSKLYMLVMPEVSEDSTGFNTAPFNGAFPEVVIYAGENYEAVTATGKMFSSYTAKPISEYDPTKTYTGRNLFYGATTCSKCNGLLAEEETFNFTDYFSAFNKGKVCTHCLDVDKTAESGAMFEYFGYSVPQNGAEGIAVKYTVNTKAIENYNEMTGKTLTYGLYAVTKKAVGESDIINADGTVVAGALVAEVPSKYVIMELKMAGFQTSEQKEALFAFGAYVKVTDDTTVTYDYLEKGTPAEGEKYCFVSYNDIIKSLS